VLQSVEGAVCDKGVSVVCGVEHSGRGASNEPVPWLSVCGSP
jgi:hypothetical protein